MSDQIPGGSTDKIRVFLWNGSGILTGRSPVVSIQRNSDNKFWTGSVWQAAYIALAMTEETGNVAVEGMYFYNFSVPTGAEGYDWSVKETINSVDAYTKGRIRATA